MIKINRLLSVTGKQTVFVLFCYDILYAVQQTLKSVFLENVLVIACLIGYHIVDNSHSEKLNGSLVIGKDIRTCLHKHMHTSFRQILLHTALKILAVRQHACGFLPCLQQNYARKSAHISYEDRFL